MARIFDTFPAHLFVEMYYHRKHRFGLIYEDKLNSHDFRMLCEEYGVFDGCHELAVEIAKHVRKVEREGGNMSYFNSPDQAFIKVIEISLIHGASCSYSPDNSNIVEDYNNCYFALLSLNIGVDVNDEDLIAGIMHELLHAYEDFQRHSNSAIGLHQKAYNLGYYKNNISRVDQYAGIKYVLSYILYFMTNFERNAYIAQIIGHIKQSKHHFKDINEVLQFIRSTNAYENYMTIIHWSEDIMELDEENSPYLCEKVISCANQLSNHKFRTMNQFKKWLQRNIYSIQNKFNQIIPKIAMEQLYMQESFNNPNDLLLKYKKMW